MEAGQRGELSISLMFINKRLEFNLDHLRVLCFSLASCFVVFGRYFCAFFDMIFVVNCVCTYVWIFLLLVYQSLVPCTGPAVSMLLSCVETKRPYYLGQSFCASVPQ